MATSDYCEVSFTESDTRRDEMHSTIETWVETLVSLVNEAEASDEFQKWLDVQSRFHDYSHRNTLLINLQHPTATRVAGYRTWQREFDRHVKKGESAIWIWVPIIAKQCPQCRNSPSYHRRSDCEYDEKPSEDWSKGLVGFKPAPVFDISQTEGEPLPELETEATGDGAALVSRLLKAADELGVSVQVVPPREWSYGAAKGICRQESAEEVCPIVEVKASKNSADLAVTLIHEYAHAILHFDAEEIDEQSKREVEAEAVAYIVGRYFGLDSTGSTYYLAAWQGEDSETIVDRLGRISRTASEIIECIDSPPRSTDSKIS